MDSIRAEMLEYISEYISHRLCELINLGTEMGEVWKNNEKNPVIDNEHFLL